MPRQFRSHAWRASEQTQAKRHTAASATRSSARPYAERPESAGGVELLEKMINATGPTRDHGDCACRVDVERRQQLRDVELSYVPSRSGLSPSVTIVMQNGHAAVMVLQPVEVS